MIIAIDGFMRADNIKEVSRLGVRWMGLDFVSGSQRRVGQMNTLAGILPDSPLLATEGLAAGAEMMGVFCDEMPQSIVTRVYNFHLGVVRLDGAESPVLIDNLRRTIDPDIHPGLTIVKTLRVRQRADIALARHYAGHADSLLFDMADAPWEWLADYDAATPFLIGGGLSEKDAPKMRGYHHPRHIGFCLGATMEQEVGCIDVEKVRELMQSL